MLKKLIDLAKAAYATPTGYRLAWTAVQVGSGAVAVALGADPKIGAVVVLVTTALTSIARERLAKAKA